MSPAAAAAIRQCHAPIYNGYNEGGILVWFVPGQPVFIDSRQDPYPVSLVQAHAAGRAERKLQSPFRSLWNTVRRLPGVALRGSGTARDSRMARAVQR